MPPSRSAAGACGRRRTKPRERVEGERETDPEQRQERVETSAAEGGARPPIGDAGIHACQREREDHSRSESPGGPAEPGQQAGGSQVQNGRPGEQPVARREQHAIPGRRRRQERRTLRDREWRSIQPPPDDHLRREDQQRSRAEGRRFLEQPAPLRRDAGAAAAPRPAAARRSARWPSAAAPAGRTPRRARPRGADHSAAARATARRTARQRRRRARGPWSARSSGRSRGRCRSRCPVSRATPQTGWLRAGP